MSRLAKRRHGSLPAGTWSLLVALVCAGSARAADETRLELALSSELSYGEAVAVRVRVIQPEEGQPAPRLPRVAGLTFRGPRKGAPRRETVSRVVGGRTYTRTTVSVDYMWEIRPDAGRTGSFTIGPATIARSGKPPIRSDRARLAVYRRPELGLGLECELSMPEGEIGAPFRATYYVTYPQDAELSAGPLDTPFSSLRVLFPFLGSADLRVTPIRTLEDREAYRLGYDKDTQLVFQRALRVDEEGVASAALVFAFEIVPRRVGSISLGRAVARMRLQTGEYTIERGFFGARRVPEVRYFEAKSEDLSYTVRTLPEEGRPEGFTGAIGRFEVEVTTRETRVGTFDPIPLEIRVRGQGLLENLSAPDWASLDWLTRDFDVSRDVDAGTVEGDVKIFRQTIRARHAEIREIPALPFPYYDPWDRRYSVARSKPIPITVLARDTVGAEDAIVKSGAEAPEPRATVRAPLPLLEQSGVGANFAKPGAATRIVGPREALLRWPFLLACGLPPLLFAALLLALRSLDRSPEQRARSRALMTARSRLAEAAGDAEKLSAAVQGYLRDRFSLPPGELTPDEVSGILSRTDVGADAIGEARALMDEVLALRFGGQRAPDDVEERALSLLRKVDRCREPGSSR